MDEIFCTEVGAQFTLNCEATLNTWLRFYGIFAVSDKKIKPFIN